MPPQRSPLFPAIVLAGISLTAPGCGNDTQIVADDTGKASDAKSDVSAADTTLGDTGSADTGVVDSTSSDVTDTLDAADGCPPDSEIPTPPCSFIR